MSGALSGKTVIALACGERHTVALCSDNTLAAWGANNVGQLGTGNTTPSAVKKERSLCSQMVLMPRDRVRHRCWGEAMRRRTGCEARKDIQGI